MRGQDLGRGADGHDVAAVDRHRAVRDHAARPVHGDDGAVGHDHETARGSALADAARRIAERSAPEIRFIAPF